MQREKAHSGKIFPPIRTLFGAQQMCWNIVLEWVFPLCIEIFSSFFFIFNARPNLMCVNRNQFVIYLYEETSDRNVV